MGTFLFWGAWLAGAVFFKLTTPAQRHGWLINFWILACCSLLGTEALSLLRQGYLTVA